MTTERIEYYAKTYLLDRIAYWSNILEEIDEGGGYTEKEKAEFYHIYMDYKNELADLDVDIGNLTEEGHW